LLFARIYSVRFLNKSCTGMKASSLLLLALVLFAVLSVATCKKGEEQNFYEILGVPKDASEKDIKKAFRTLSKEWHPDKVGPSGEEKYETIVAAYETLVDAEKRKIYDWDLDQSWTKNLFNNLGQRGKFDTRTGPNKDPAQRNSFTDCQELVFSASISRYFPTIPNNDVIDWNNATQVDYFFTTLCTAQTYLNCKRLFSKVPQNTFVYAFHTGTLDDILAVCIPVEGEANNSSVFTYLRPFFKGFHSKDWFVGSIGYIYYVGKISFTPFDVRKEFMLPVLLLLFLFPKRYRSFLVKGIVPQHAELPSVFRRLTSYLIDISLVSALSSVVLGFLIYTLYQYIGISLRVILMYFVGFGLGFNVFTYWFLGSTPAMWLLGMRSFVCSQGYYGLRAEEKIGILRAVAYSLWRCVYFLAGTGLLLKSLGSGLIFVAVLYYLADVIQILGDRACGLITLHNFHPPKEKVDRDIPRNANTKDSVHKRRNIANEE